MAPHALPQTAVLVTVVAVVGAFRAPRPGLAPRPRQAPGPRRRRDARAFSASEIVPDASLPTDPPREVESIAFGGNDCTPSLGKRRHVCCMLFVVSVIFAVALASR